MKILKAYRYRIYPNKLQQQYLNQVFGSVRFVWNQLVANFNAFGTNEFNIALSEKDLKEIHTFLNESISYALQQKRIDFEQTKKQFFNTKRKVKLGRMKFKKKGIANDSFRIPAQALTKPFDFDNSVIKLTKLGKVKCIFDRKFIGAFKSVTISKTKTNKYYASVLVEEESSFKPKSNNVVGIDLGLKELLTLSNGDVFKNPGWFRESQSKLAKAQKHLSRKTRGSNRYKKQRLNVTKIHEKIVNQRKWYIHNITSWIVNTFDIICIEDLNVEGMKKKFGKSISDAVFSEITRQLTYKAFWYGKSISKIDRWFPSSKMCSCCGNVNKDLTLKDRTYVCAECGAVINRDLNASINILNQGLLDSSAEAVDYTRGEELRLKECLHSSIASSMKRL